MDRLNAVAHVIEVPVTFWIEFLESEPEGLEADVWRGSALSLLAVSPLCGSFAAHGGYGNG